MLRVLCFASTLLVALPAWPQSYRQLGIRYLSGGATPDAQMAMREAADDYNLRLEFSAGWPPRYVEAGWVRIRDRSGRVVLALRRAGPVLFVDLPRGLYVVRAAREGVQRIRQVVVGEHSGMTARFAWPTRAEVPMPAWQG